MQFVVVFLLFFNLCFCRPHEGLPLLNPGGIGGIFKGSDSETIIRGPDGSEITSEEKGGSIVRDDNLNVNPIVVAEPLAPALIAASTGSSLIDTAPVVSSAAPILASSPSPLLTGEIAGPEYASIVQPEALAVAPLDVKPVEIIEQDPHVIETEIIEAPDVEPDQSSDLKGPSGRIITKGSASVVSGPASTTITEPRKIIVAPPKIAIGTPVIATATIPLREAHLPLVAASTIAPPVLSYSTTAAPLVGISSTLQYDTSQIDLGAGAIRESIPVIECSSSNGVLNGLNGIVSSTEAPLLSSTVTTVTDKYAPSEGPAIPSAYLTAPAALPAANIQKIPRFGDNIAVDGRVDMGYSLYRKRAPQSYHLPEVLSMALTRFYSKGPVKEKKHIVIDDKMGELTRNEIAYEPRGNFLPPPDLSQSEFIAPALARNGIDASQVNLASVPLSQVTRLPDGGYRLDNRYQREAKRF